MQVAVEQKEGLIKELAITIDASNIDTKVAKKLEDTAKRVHLNGFRPGAVPVKVISKRFGKQIRREVLSDLIESASQEAIAQEKIRAAGISAIDITQDEPGKDFIFKASVETFPEVSVQGLEKIQIEKVAAEVKVEDINEMLNTLQKQQADWKSVERAAQNDDRVTIDFEGFIDGEAFQGGSATDFHLVLGSKQMIPGFEEQLLGLKAGDTHTIEVTFPEDYHQKSLAGKQSSFNITMKDVCIAELPALDDELAKRFDVESFEKLKEEIQQNMQRELRFSLKNQLKNQVMEGLLAQNPIEVPQTVIQQEIEALKYESAKQYGMDKNDQWKKLPDSLYAEQAKRRVALALLVGSLVEQHELKPDAERVKALVNEMSSVYQDSAEAVQHILQDRQRLAQYEQMVMEDMIVELVLAAAKVTEVEKSFKAVMHPEPQPQAEAEKAVSQEEA